MSPLTYAHVYNRAYKCRRTTLDAWARARLRRARTLPMRLSWGKHLLTLSRTQHMGTHMTLATRGLAHATHRLAVLGMLCRLRVLQRHILRHLWRPGGALMVRQMHRAQALFTPTPGAAS